MKAMRIVALGLLALVVILVACEEEPFGEYKPIAATIEDIIDHNAECWAIKSTVELNTILLGLCDRCAWDVDAQQWCRAFEEHAEQGQKVWRETCNEKATREWSTSLQDTCDAVERIMIPQSSDCPGATLQLSNWSAFFCD